ncbi:sperm flagellar protein 2 [Stegastes partitus]|uniref:Sperm flagellar protein 2 n=1 Tax=Stegastes partitus TaxID=144197 RepID=A0A9Y4NAS1_9TELE|nr:PREDICTED: sperm flagellar protein 2 [Stegastes partitus]
MSDILCRWLNRDLRLSRAVEPDTFANDFSSGYLIGEVLHKYQLQKDFSMFMKKDTSISKMNNFTRIEPTLKLLGISFDINTAQDLMQEKQGAATRLLHQLYVSLEKNKKAEIGGTMMEIMQPSASANLHKKEHEIYSDRLHQVVKRDAELKLQKIPQHYGDKSQQWCDRSVMNHPVHQKRRLRVQDEKQRKDSEKLRVCPQKFSDMNQATNVQVTKLPPYASTLNLKKRQQQQQQRKERQAQTVQTDIAQFETNKKKLVTSGFASSSSDQPSPADFLLGSSNQDCEVPGSGTNMMLQSNSKYIQEIRQRLEENAVACEQSKKRVDRFLVEQFKAHEAQKEAWREEQLVRRLTRQTRQEQGLAAQLLQTRAQKEVIRENRLFREQQYQQRREKDFREALDREAVLAQQAKLDRAEEIRKELEFCNRMAAERAHSRYEKHFKSCKDILEQIVDLATKVGEYRKLTGNLIPGKLMREWKELLFRGLPLFEPVKGHQPQFSTQLDPVELKKQETLNTQDYDEYTSMVGEWAWPEEAGETKLPPANNDILGHVVHRLRSVVHPPVMEPPVFPNFTIKACVLGKICSGKTTCLAKIAEAHGICVLSTDTLIEEAVNAYRNGEEDTQQQGEKDGEQQLASSTSLKSDLDTQEEGKDSNARLSTRAVQGAAAENELRKGKPLPNELLVDIVVEAISQVPAQSGWILDGFPVDISQAHLLEEALGGSVDAGNEAVSSQLNLAADPNPPKPPPPPAPVLDLALLLDVPDERVVKRAFDHIDTNTAAGTTSKPTDQNLYLAQIPQRITGFQENWPELEEWFGGKQNILVRVDADVDDDELYSRVESVLQQVMLEAQEALASPPVKDAVLDSAEAPDSSSPSATPPLPGRPPAPTDKELGPKESHSSLKEKKVRSVTSLSKSNTHSPRGHSGNASASSVSNEDSQTVAKNPTESVSSCPTSSSQAYVDKPLPSEIPKHLSLYWDELCNSYVNSAKKVMQQLRSQRTDLNHHLYNVREGYKHYLRRPDLKQELVSQWQKDFNSVPDDMRKEDTNAELHLRLDELRERLWDISDKRKEKDEQERTALMCDRWLEEHTAVLVNQHSALIQVELNRFQKTLHFLRVYYLSMYTQVLPEPPSKLASIPLLETPETKDQNESNHPPGTSLLSHMDDGEDRKKTKFTLLLRRPDSSKGGSDTKGQDQTEPLQQPEEKLISDFEGALTAIDKLVSAEAHQRETKEQKEKVQEKEKEKEKASENPKKTKKGKQSAKKQKGIPPPAPSPAPADDRNSEKTRDQEVREKIHKEYTAALNAEENAAKVRIALVKGHGLVMLHSLQSRAEQAFSSMEKWLAARYLAEMKSIDQLSDVVHHSIEAGAKLQNKLMLECSDFYLNGDHHMVPDPAPPPHPPSPTQSTRTITQLESLHQKLCDIAPSGLMSSSKFSSFLKGVSSGEMGKCILPEPRGDTNEAQMMEIVSLLMDGYELIDWRRFLLSAALPWPFPSLTQLLAVRQRFKAADAGDAGYIHKEQYLQIELWFSHESVQTVPEDPPEPAPFDHLANLREFFFQLFADHSFSPSRLDYVSMLQYFAADPNPRQGFIRALSVVMGQHLQLSSLDHLVKSMPRMEEATELTSSELDGDYKEEEPLCASSSLFGEQGVSISALLAVICHKITEQKDDSPRPPGCLSREELTESLVQLFRELGYEPEDRVPFSVLSQHPFIQVLLETLTHYQLVSIHSVLLARDGTKSLFCMSESSPKSSPESGQSSPESGQSSPKSGRSSPELRPESRQLSPSLESKLPSLLQAHQDEGESDSVTGS